MKNKEQNTEQTEKQINQLNLWERFKEFIGLLFIAIFFLICIFGILYLFITLIENSLSLAIVCGTILLIIFWWLR